MCEGWLWCIPLSQLQMTEEAQRKESQLQEKREQVLLAKSEVDRVTGELMETRQMAQSLRSQLESAMVCIYFCLTDKCKQLNVVHCIHRQSYKRKQLSYWSW